MRIVHVVDYFQPGIGYQEYYLAVCQAAAGHEVHVVTSDRYKPFPDYAQTVGSLLGPRFVGAGVSKLEGVEVHRLPCRFEYRRNALWLRGLEETLAKLKPDVLNVDDVFTLTGGRIARMNRRLRRPLVFDTHAADYNTGIRKSLRHRLSLGAFRKWVVPEIRSEADVLIAIDEGTRQMLCREFNIPADRIPIIPLGADARAFRPDPAARAIFRDGWKLGGAFVLVFTGKLHPEKGAHTVLEAAELVAKQLDGPMHVVVVGNGPQEYMERLDAIAARPGLRGRVIFIRRFLDRSNLNEVFNGADVGVWPAEPSNVIQEALAAGLPIVVPDRNSQGLSNAPYVARQNGLLFERGKLDSLVSALLTLGKDEERRKGMAVRARQLVDSELSWTAIANQFVVAFERALEIRERRRAGSRGPYAVGRIQAENTAAPYSPRAPG
jgi:glycosyltransferase involved in cell wall biosynthesis